MKTVLAGVDALSDLELHSVDKPVRPAVPWLLLPFSGLWCGLAASFWLCGSPEQYPYSAPAFVLVFLGMAALASLVVVLLSSRSKRTIPALVSGLVFAIVIGTISGIQYWPGVIGNGYALQTAADAQLDILATDDARESDFSGSSTVKVFLPDGKTVNTRVYWQSDQEPLLSGQSAKAVVSAKPLTEKNATLAMGGISATASLADIQDVRFADDILGSISARRAANSDLIAQTQSPGSALVQGMVLGDSRALDNTQTARNFKLTGLMHLVAVSGSHLAVIAALLGWLLQRTSARGWLRALILMALLASYVVLTGFQPSAIRSAIMASVGAVSFSLGRRRHTPSLLCAAAIAMLLLDPSNTFDVGFWLSVFAVLGISMFYPLASSLLSIHQNLAQIVKSRERKDKGLNALKRFINLYIAQPTALTLVAQAATLPLSAAFFGMLSIISPLANLLAAPFATLIVGVGIFALTINQFSDPLTLLTLQAVCLVAEVLDGLVAWLAALPLVATPFYLGLQVAVVAAIVLAVCLYLFWRHITRKFCICVLSVILVFAALGSVWTRSTAAPELVMMDVGQGDALLIRDGTSSVLVDTGPSDTELVKALARQGVRHLDAVMLTHLDDDHVGALDALSGVVSVGSVYFADGLTDATRAGDVRADALKLTGHVAATLRRGDTLRIGAAMTALVVWPSAPAAEGANEESICLLLRYDAQADGVPEFQSLLMGDAESGELEQIIASEKLGVVDVLKVGHHGSTDAVQAEQLQHLRSKIALISAGRNNRFGHPTAATLDQLQQAQVSVYRTDQQGDISLRFTPSRLDVSYTGYD